MKLTNIKQYEKKRCIVMQIVVTARQGGNYEQI